MNEVIEQLQTRRWPSDESFDRFLPRDVQEVSSRYWTPLAVAGQVATWLDELDVSTVVDIGSGAGKFCVVAALAGRGTRRFLGLEQRPWLVRAARELVDRFGINDRVRFVEGALGEAPVPAAGAYYLFNPFGENVFCAGDPLDNDVELTEERLATDVARVEQLLRLATVGTYLVTYHGFGGTTPTSYEEIRIAGVWPHIIRCWRKSS